MAEKNAQQRMEEIRGFVLAYLAQRVGLEFKADAVARGINREENAGATVVEAIQALAFLQGLGFVQSEPDPLGSTRSYQATSEGVLHHERSGR